MTSRRRRATAVTLTAVGWLLAMGTASAHGGSLAAGSRESLTIPTWLFLSTGGAAVGASFLLASFVTDRVFIERIHDWGTPLSGGVRPAVWLGRAVGLVGFAAVIGLGFFGPTTPQTNLAILLVWVGWWAGLAMTTYLLGNTWRVLNPLSTIALVLPSLDRDYPTQLGAWPSVVGLLALVWLEVVSPLADEPRLLATAVLGYSVVTLTGAVVFGRETWFDEADPVERVFRYYGRVAPIGRGADGRLRLRLPGMDLSTPRLVDGRDEVAFVVALLWATTYDGLVTTPAFRDLTTPLVDAGLPAHLLYPVVLAAGFALFLGVYRLAVRSSRRTAETYLSPAELAERFAPPLLAIAAGYHFAHYLGYFLVLAPALGLALLSPLSDPGAVPIYEPPAWFGGVGIAAVIVGHLVAIWVAHAAAYDLFPARMQAIRSQYPFIAVMVFYTMTSLWVVTRPEVPLPHL